MSLDKSPKRGMLQSKSENKDNAIRLQKSLLGVSKDALDFRNMCENISTFFENINLKMP